MRGTPATRLISLAGLALLCGVACSQGQPPEAASDLRRDAVLEILPTPDSATDATPIRVAVEIADDPHEQSVGLMHRRLADDGQGMLFVFPESAPRVFWMRNTPGSLDLLFLDPGLRLIALIRDAEPLSDRRLRSGAPARYVLEVPGGFADRHGLRLGAQVRIEPPQDPPSHR